MGALGKVLRTVTKAGKTAKKATRTAKKVHGILSETKLGNNALRKAARKVKNIDLTYEQEITTALDEFYKTANRRFQNIKKSGLIDINNEYYQTVEAWLKFEPESVDDEFLKIQNLSDFIENDTASTVVGLKKAIKEKARLEQQYGARFDDLFNADDGHVGYNWQSLDVNEASTTATKFLAWRRAQGLKANSFADAGESREEIKKAIFEWHYMGEPWK